MFTTSKNQHRYPVVINGQWENDGATIRYHIDPDPHHLSKRRITIIQKEEAEPVIHEGHLMLIGDHLHLYLEGALHKLQVKKFWRSSLHITMPGGYTLKLFKRKPLNPAGKFVAFTLF